MQNFLILCTIIVFVTLHKKHTDTKLTNLPIVVILSAPWNPGIWRPGAGLAGTRDSMAQIWDIPGNPGRVATLATIYCGWFRITNINTSGPYHTSIRSLNWLPVWRRMVSKTTTPPTPIRTLRTSWKCPRLSLDESINWISTYQE